MVSWPPALNSSGGLTMAIMSTKMVRMLSPMGWYHFLDLDQTFPVALADSENNVWGDIGEPIPGEETVYIAKAWCLGDLTLDPVGEGLGENPSVDPGVDCDGTALDNTYQTDSATLDIVFSAIQARHNGDYLCEGPTTGSITIIKEVEGGDADP